MRGTRTDEQSSILWRRWKIVLALDVIARAGASVIRSLSDQLKMMADGCEAKCGLHIERKKEREHDINAHPGRKN